MAASLTVVNFFLVALFATVAAQLASVKLYRCSHSVGLSPWASVWDSRLPNYPIACADGRRPVELSLTATNQFSLTIRSLQRAVLRQGVIVQFQLTSGIAQLVGFCITDTQPTGQSTPTANNASPYVGNTCGGVSDSASTGSPQFNPETDDGRRPVQGWAIRNPPPKDPTGLFITETATGSVLPGASLKAPTGVCNFYYSWNFAVNEATAATPNSLMGPSAMGGASVATRRFVYNSAHADSAGLDSYRGIQGKEAYDGAGGNVAGHPVAPCQWTSFNDKTAINPYKVVGITFVGTPKLQAYGAPTAVLVSYAASPIHNPVGPDSDLTLDYTAKGGKSGTGNVMYANFFSTAQSLIGFQLRCVKSTANEYKWITISFFGRNPVQSYLPTESPFQLNYPEPSSGTGVQQWNGNSAPRDVLGSILIKATCQNIATATPTPPLYPFNYKFPIIPGTPNTASLFIEQCEYQCQDREFQYRLIKAIRGICNELGNNGCSVLITCVTSVRCFDVVSTTELVASTRRGLQGLVATRTSWLMTITVSAYAVQTVQLVATRIRATSLFPWVSPFSALRILWYSKTGAAITIPFNTPSTAVQITSFPSIQAPWTGACYVYGNACTSTPCAAQCNNGAIRKVTTFTDGEIFCSCNTCGNDPKTSAYVFTSFACSGSKDQSTADVCCWNVQQDAVCWALDNPGVVQSDKDLIPGWTYRPPSIAERNPTKPPKNDGPKTCPTSSQSSKGLLGLLGLLGLIPLCLCCLLLLLCLIRRKKREGDVHFATFDPNAAPCATACPSIPVCPSVPVCAAL